MVLQLVLLVLLVLLLKLRLLNLFSKIRWITLRLLTLWLVLPRCLTSLVSLMLWLKIFKVKRILLVLKQCRRFLILIMVTYLLIIVVGFVIRVFNVLSLIMILKPAAAKGSYVKSIFLSTTMSPGLQIDAKSVETK